MTALAFNVTGVPRLDRKLAQLPKKARDRVVRQALRPAADMLLNVARTRTPKDTGRLLASEKVARLAKRNRVGFKIGSTGKASGGGYARFAELGRRKRRMAGAAYLRKPFYAARERIVRAARAALIDALR